MDTAKRENISQKPNAVPKIWKHYLGFNTPKRSGSESVQMQQHNINEVIRYYTN